MKTRIEIEVVAEDKLNQYDKELIIAQLKDIVLSYWNGEGFGRRVIPKVAEINFTSKKESK
ncbi:MAG: hypothetical protein R3213_06790 [Flavobacteriaceae bacterium]|nr:hypothetical protein [Flavobacteriaceae bacterium]